MTSDKAGGLLDEPLKGNVYQENRQAETVSKVEIEFIPITAQSRNKNTRYFAALETAVEDTFARSSVI